MVESAYIIAEWCLSLAELEFVSINAALGLNRFMNLSLLSIILETKVRYFNFEPSDLFS